MLLLFYIVFFFLISDILNIEVANSYNKIWDIHKLKYFCVGFCNLVDFPRFFTVAKWNQNDLKKVK